MNFAICGSSQNQYPVDDEARLYTYRYQIITLYILNLHNVICQLYLSHAVKK